MARYSSSSGRTLFWRLASEAIFIPLIATIWWLPLTTFFHANIKWAPMLFVGFVLSMLAEAIKGAGGLRDMIIIVTFWLPTIASAAAIVVRLSN